MVSLCGSCMWSVSEGAQTLHLQFCFEAQLTKILSNHAQKLLCGSHQPIFSGTTICHNILSMGCFIAYCTPYNQVLCLRLSITQLYKQKLNRN